MKKKYSTDRLRLKRLRLEDNDFIFDLLNSEGWLTFIGDRGIKTKDDSQKYIQLTLADPNITYWVVKSRVDQVSVGLISFIKRDYLDHHDLGFAFLPAFLNRGYAYEAAGRVLQDLLKDPHHKTILATARVDNIRSAKLLEKLGFQFKNEMEHENKRILLYCITRR